MNRGCEQNSTVTFYLPLEIEPSNYKSSDPNATLPKLVPPPTCHESLKILRENVVLPQDLKQNQLVICSWNVNGWTPANHKLRSSMLELIDWDLIAIIETHWTSNWYPELPEVTRISTDRQGADKNSGGVGILIKNQVLKHFQISRLDLDNDHICAVNFQSVHNQENDFVLIAVYLPPSGSRFSIGLVQILQSLSDLIDSLATPYILAGDFNARLGEAKDIDIEFDQTIPLRRVTDRVENQYGRLFLDFLQNINGLVLNGRFGDGEFTCERVQGNSVVDYIIVPYESYKNVLDFEITTLDKFLLLNPGLIADVGLSSRFPDHNLLTCRWKYEAKITQSKFDTISYAPPVRNVPDHFLAEVGPECLNLRPGSITDVNELLNDFVTIINTEINRLELRKPKKLRAHTKWKKYWDTDLKTAWHIWRDSLRLLKSERKKGRSNKYLCKLRDDTKMLRKNFDRMLKSKKNKIIYRDLEMLETSVKKNPSNFWKAVNSLDPKKSGIDMKIIEDGVIKTDPTAVLDFWMKSFESLYGMTSSEMNSLPRYDSVNANPDKFGFDAAITSFEVRNAVQMSKNGKAVGLDDISYELLRNKNVQQLLVVIYNYMFSSRQTPEAWRYSGIHPIPKGSTSVSTDPMSYRGLALQSCIYKIYSSILNQRLSSYLENNDVLTDYQFGFRRKRSCLDCVFILDQIIRKSFMSGDKTYCCFVDFKKAFDLVPRDIMIDKLRNLGVSGLLLESIGNIYSETWNCVLLNGMKSGFFQNACGVKQGDPLSPTLLSIFVNDLVEKLNGDGFCALAFADDIVIWSKSLFILQDKINVVHMWCILNGMKISVEKTKIMCFQKRGTSDGLRFHVGSALLEKVEEFKYLGVWLDTNLTYKPHAKVVEQKSRQALGKLWQKFLLPYKKPRLKTFMHLLKTCIEPIMTYGIAIWGQTLCKDSWNRLNSVLIYAKRKFLGVGPFTPIAGIQFLFDDSNLEELCSLEMFRMYNRKCVSQTKNLSTDLIFEVPWKDNVVKFIQKIYDLEFSEWACERIESKMLLRISKLYIIMSNMRRLRIDLKLKACSKLDHLHFLLDTADRRKYVQNVLLVKNPSERSILSKLLLGTLPLEIETGRWERTDRELRFCKICGKQEVEDIWHFLFYCKEYHNVSLPFLKDRYIDAPDCKTSLYNILRENDTNQVAKYISELWRLRLGLNL